MASIATKTRESSRISRSLGIAVISLLLAEAVELPEWLAAQARPWPFADPVAGNTLAAFEQARDLIEAALFDWLTSSKSGHRRRAGAACSPSADGGCGPAQDVVVG